MAQLPSSVGDGGGTGASGKGVTCGMALLGIYASSDFPTHSYPGMGKGGTLGEAARGGRSGRFREEVFVL